MVKTQLLTPGKVDEVAYEKFVARETRGFQKMIDSGHPDSHNIGDPRKAAESMCAMYRHNFRKLVPIDPQTRKPL